MSRIIDPRVQHAGRAALLARLAETEAKKDAAHAARYERYRAMGIKGAATRMATSTPEQRSESSRRGYENRRPRDPNDASDEGPA